MRHGLATLFAGLVVIGLLSASPAGAMSLKECSALYQTAKADGTLGTMNWTEFRTARCAGGQVQAKGAAAGDTKGAVQGAATPLAAQAMAPGTPVKQMVPDSLFPDAVDPKFAAEKPTLARLHTCAVAYRSAKQAQALNGLRWIQKGGGFYSLCNRKLKAGKG